jgi:hypothetical protein
MVTNSDVPVLLEKFIQISGTTARWITVREIREHFVLDRHAAPAIAGFLQRIYRCPVSTTRCRVERIGTVRGGKERRYRTRRYFVTVEPMAAPFVQSMQDQTPGLLTDNDVIDLFNRILEPKREGNESY